MTLYSEKNSKPDYRWHGLDLPFEHLIALRIHANRIHLQQKKKATTYLIGSKTAMMHARGMDFVEVRRYQSGDDIRCMDWRVTARTGKPHTKLFREEREQPIYLLVNLSSSMQFGSRITFKSNVAAQIAALLAWNALSNKDRIGGFIFNDHTKYFSKPTPSNHGVLPFLKKIIDLNQPEQQFTENFIGFNTALGHYKNLFKSGCKFFIISDFFCFDQNEQQFYAQVSQSNQLYFIHIYDTLEAKAPKPNIYRVSDGQQLFQFDSSAADFRKDYQNSFNLELEKIKNFCMQQQIQFISIATDADIISVLGGKC